MRKSYEITSPNVTRNNFYTWNIPLDYEFFKNLVESCEWLTWAENTVHSKDFYIERPNIPRKKRAYLDNENDKYIGYYDYSCTAYFDISVNYKDLKLVYEFAKKLGCILWENGSLDLVDEAYLEALRIKEENRGIKLTKEQSHVLSCVEDQCRWFYIPTGDTEVIIKQLGLQKEIQEADITTIIEDVQNENKIAMAIFLEDTIIFGMNVPYIQYPNLNAYKLTKGSSTPVLQNTLNALSKTFGFAAYYEYNNDDELIASLAFSKKGKFTYGHFSSEGQGVDIFGTQKKPMEVTQKSILKVAKKQGITPEDMLVNLMKQKQKVKYFTQCNWMIEDMLSM